MEEFNQELYEDTMLESENNYSEYAKIYSDFRDKYAAIQLTENEEIKETLINNLKQKYILEFSKSSNSNDQALIDTYIDILGELGVSNYYLDNYIENDIKKTR